MTTPDTWRKSSYSGGNDGNNCVEIVPSPTRIAIRDSKDPALGTLTFPAEAFIPLIRAIRTSAR